jgi:hypothetical protein
LQPFAFSPARRRASDVTLDIGVFYPDQGNFLIPAMASVFVGGTSIAGGAGSIFGTFFGSYVIGSLAAGVVATTISGYWIQVVHGGGGCFQRPDRQRRHNFVVETVPTLECFDSARSAACVNGPNLGLLAYRCVIRIDFAAKCS